MLKTHYRRVVYGAKWNGGATSITIPCGTDAHITRNTTKETENVTCKRCLKWLSKQTGEQNEHNQSR